MELNGRRVLVTGASRGIGEALARAFAAAGSRVVVVARSEAPLKELARDIGGIALAADLTDLEHVAGLLGRIEVEDGPVDILVNNAGLELVGEFAATTAAEIEEIYRLNLITPVQLCRQVIPGMVARGAGHIVNISSMAGVGAFPGLTAYSSTKAGLTHFTAGLRTELHGLPIGTTVVELGPVPTEMLGRIDEYPPAAQSFQRFHRLGLLVDVDRNHIARTVVDAVRSGRRHVRHPKRAIAFALATEAPRKIVEIVLSGVPRR